MKSFSSFDLDRMTPKQREIVDRLIAKGWYPSMFYRRSAYFRPTEKVIWEDGTQHRIDSWHRRGIKVTPSGQILLSR